MSGRLWPLAAVVVTATAVALVAADVDSVVRPPVAIAFLAFAPGVALTWPLGGRSLAVRIVLASLASLTIDLMVVIGLLAADAWSATAPVYVIAAITVVAAATTRWGAR